MCQEETHACVALKPEVWDQHMPRLEHFIFEFNPDRLSKINGVGDDPFFCANPHRAHSHNLILGSRCRVYPFPTTCESAGIVQIFTDNLVGGALLNEAPFFQKDGLFA
jgi:hypothetical protein